MGGGGGGGGGHLMHISYSIDAYRIVLSMYQARIQGGGGKGAKYAQIF